MDSTKGVGLVGESLNFDEFSFKAFKLHGFLSKVALGYGKLCPETKGFVWDSYEIQKVTGTRMDIGELLALRRMAFSLASDRRSGGANL